MRIDIMTEYSETWPTKVSKKTVMAIRPNTKHPVAFVSRRQYPLSSSRHLQHPNYCETITLIDTQQEIKQAQHHHCMNMPFLYCESSYKDVCSLHRSACQNVTSEFKPEKWTANFHSKGDDANPYARWNCGLHKLFKVLHSKSCKKV